MKKYAPLFIVLSLLTLLLIPAIFIPFQYGDECIYLTIGNALRHGATLYRDIHDNKPPLIYLVAAASFGHLWLFQLFGVVAIISQFTLLYFFLKEIVPARKSLIILIAGVLLAFIFEARIANGEIFMMLPILLATFILWKKRTNLTVTSAFLIGLCFSLGILFKAPAGFDILGIILAFFWLFPNPRRRLLWPLLSGVGLPILLSLLHFAIHGGFTPYLRSALLQNIGYLASWNHSYWGLILRIIILFFLWGGLYLRRQHHRPFCLLGASWFLWALFGALLAGRPYPHYLWEALPSFILLSGCFFQPKKEWPLPSLAIVLFLVSWFSFHFWWYPQVPFYQNFFRYLTGQQTQRQYLSFWGKRVQNNYRLAQFIRRTVPDNQPIFIWGDAACVYALSRHPPAGRYTVNYHIYDYNGFAATSQALRRQPPAIIVKMASETRDWPALDQFLEQHYYLIHQNLVPDSIYHRLPDRWHSLGMSFR